MLVAFLGCGGTIALFVGLVVFFMVVHECQDRRARGRPAKGGSGKAEELTQDQIDAWESWIDRVEDERD